MTDEERDVIRTKLLLMDTGTYKLASTGGYKNDAKTWAIVKFNTSYFRFKDNRLRVFYATEDEALVAGLEAMLAKSQLTGMPWEAKNE